MLIYSYIVAGRNFSWRLTQREYDALVRQVRERLAAFQLNSLAADSKALETSSCISRHTVIPKAENTEEKDYSDEDLGNDKPKDDADKDDDGDDDDDAYDPDADSDAEDDDDDDYDEGGYPPFSPTLS